jgi:hypothetical protein
MNRRCCVQNYAALFCRGMELEIVYDLYLHELRDLYSAEQQRIKALPKMSNAATNRHLSAGFNQHLQQTKQHAKRLEQIFEPLEEKAFILTSLLMAVVCVSRTDRPKRQTTEKASF